VTLPGDGEKSGRLACEFDLSMCGLFSFISIHTQRNFFHRPSVKAVCESRVMHDLAITDVDSVMLVTTARCDNV
jgi:hypothetical protein